ncbi:MAG: outer membrane protein assembly factor BamD [Thermodesulfobacteriota bacterium]|nr:outer membrane protein assembly factor BamD [Thermodesulfobacteriota bacterium]
MITKSKKRLLFLFLSLLIISYFTGCIFIHKEKETQKNKKKETVKKKNAKKASKIPTAEDYYKKAMEYYEKENYFYAEPEFKKVKDNFPLSSYATMAELKIADCYYFQKKYEEAGLSYENFKKFHPKHPRIPYTEYQIGMCYFKQIKSIDRDQLPTEKTIVQFRYLIAKYPDSPYVKDCQKKIAACQKKLVKNEFYIGNFYFKSKNYNAAISRFRSLLENYPPSEFDSKVIFYLGKCYLNLQNKTQAKSAFLIITEKYPDTEYAKEAKKILESLD